MSEADNELIDTSPAIHAPTRTDYRMSTNAVGVSIDEVGRLEAIYIGRDGARHRIDLTTEIERIAKEAVAEHEKRFHGHQI